jgi:hypothetical protein
VILGEEFEVRADGFRPTTLMNVPITSIAGTWAATTFTRIKRPEEQRVPAE